MAMTFAGGNLANAQAATSGRWNVIQSPYSDLDLEQSAKPNGTFQICSEQGQRETDRFPQPLNGRPVYRYS